MSEKCSFKGCHRDACIEDKCVFHAEKTLDYQVRDFRIALARLLREYRRAKPDMWNFRGFRFPDSKKKFGRPINISDWRFPSRVDFSYATFEEQMLLYDAIFPNEVSFESVIFEDRAGFVGVHFQNYVDFSNVHFRTDVHFFETVFWGGVNFKDALFQGAVEYSDVTFHDEAYFGGAVFAQKAEFHRDIFVSIATFIWPGDQRRLPTQPFAPPLEPGTIRFRKIDTHRGILDFSNNDLREGCRVIFEDCDLSRTKFVGTDCRRIDFRKCKWGNCWSREGVGDEHLVRSAGKNWWRQWLSIYHLRILTREADWRRIAITYNELAWNYSNNLDYPQAHHFDAGVMEMRRLDCEPDRGWRRWLWNKGKLFQWILAMQHRYLSFIAFYAFLTGYGIRYLRPLFLLMASVPFFAWIYCRNASISTLNSYWPDAVKLSLLVASVNRHGLNVIGGADLSANIVAVAQLVVTATLVTLFLFALRRRFKR